MSFRNKFILVIASATLALYAGLGNWLSTVAQQQQNDPGAQLRIFENVLYHIQRDYVDEPDLAKVRAGALRGLAYGLDPYSTYLTPEQVQNFKRTNVENQTGIGTELSQYLSYLYVIAPIKGGPADLAGVRAGDVIEYIDTKATRDISLYDAKQLLNGTAGSEVKLRILRVGSQPLQLTVKRGAVRTPVAETQLEAGGIGILRINSLDAGEAADVRGRVEDLKKQGAQKIVIDLRNVASGTIEEAAQVANLFIRDGVLAQVIGRQNRAVQTFNADPSKAVFDGTVVALIDRGTAGAAEVIASAILERKRGELVGEKSFGAGTAQELFTLRGGDGLLLTTKKWASASGKPFLGTGLQPSVEVKRPELAEAVDPETLTGSDADQIARPETPNEPRTQNTQPVVPKRQDDVQLNKALEILRGQTTQQQKRAA